MTGTRTAAMTLLAALLTGCLSSPPTRFIVLDVRAPAAATAVPANASISTVGVGKVSLPPALDRLALVRRLEGNRVDVAGLVRWAAPLDEMVRRTLARNLAARLPPAAVVLPDEPRSEEALHLFVVTIETFSAGPDNAVTLDARWTLVDERSGEARLDSVGPLHITAPARSADPDDIAGAMSEALGKLADDMVAAVAGGTNPRR